MNDFEIFIEKNKIKKKDLALFIGTSAAFVTQLVKGERMLSDDKLALIKARKEWDTTMFDEKKVTKNVKTIGNEISKNELAGSYINPVNDDTMNVTQAMDIIAKLVEQNGHLIKEVEKSGSRIDRMMDLVDRTSGATYHAPKKEAM